jgi:hypothetical protein
MGKVFVTPSDVAHILLPEEDTITLEWWDGPFEESKLTGLFKDLMKERIG